MKRVLVIGGVVALLAICGCVGVFGLAGGLAGLSASTGTTRATPIPGSTTPQPTARGTTQTLPVGSKGQPVSSGGIELTVVQVQKADRGTLGAPKAGNTFVNVQINTKNLDRDEAPYNPLYFKVKDGGGFEYNATLTAPDPSLKAGKLAKGEGASGWVQFEVPTTATGLILSYEPLVLFGGYQTIRVSLD